MTNFSHGPVEQNTKKTRVRYNHAGRPGSSGSPVFNEQLELVALHQSGGYTAGGPSSQGIPLQAILDVLRVRDLAELEPVSNRQTLSSDSRQGLIFRVRSGWIEQFGNSLPPSEMLVHTRVKFRWADEPDSMTRQGNPQLFAALAEGNQSNLVLRGEEGVGKTTLLNQLVGGVLPRVEVHRKLPVPVIFHSLSWTARRSMADLRAAFVAWMVEQLERRYYLSPKLASDLVNGSDIMPIIDGAEEIKQSPQSAQTLVSLLEGLTLWLEEVPSRQFILCIQTNQENSVEDKIGNLMGLQLTRPVGLIEVLPVSAGDARHYLQSQLRNQVEPYLARLEADKDFVRWARVPFFLYIFAQVLLERADENESAQFVDKLVPLDTENNASRFADLPIPISTKDNASRLFGILIDEWILDRSREIDSVDFRPNRIYKTLGWMARKLRTRNRLFNIDRLQPDWLDQYNVGDFKNRFALVLAFWVTLCAGIAVLLGQTTEWWVASGPMSGLSFGWFAAGTSAVSLFLVGYFGTRVPQSDLVAWVSLGIGFGAARGWTKTFSFGPNGGPRNGIITFIVTSVIAVLALGIIFRFSPKTRMLITLPPRRFGNLLICICVALILFLSGYALLRLGPTPAEGVIGLVLVICMFFVAAVIRRPADSQFVNEVGEGVKEHLRSVLWGVPLLALGGFLIMGTAFGWRSPDAQGPVNALLGLGAASGGLLIGLYELLQHLVLRRLLQRENSVPRKMELFLKYCVSARFLRRAGSGHMFMHDLLRQHFETASDRS